MADLIAELEELRLYGMAGAYCVFRPIVTGDFAKA